MRFCDELRELVTLAREALARYARGRTCATCQGKGLVAKTETRRDPTAVYARAMHVSVHPCADCHGRGWMDGAP